MVDHNQQLFYLDAYQLRRHLQSGSWGETKWDRTTDRTSINPLYHGDDVSGRQNIRTADPYPHTKTMGSFAPLVTFLGLITFTKRPASYD